MTLPVSGVISLTMVMAELRVSNPSRAYPISLGDSDVRGLAGIASGAISLSSLLGKSSYTPMTVTASSTSSGPVSSESAGGTVGGTSSSGVSGGVGPYTYSWNILQNTNAVQVGPTTGATITGTKSFAKLANGSASLTVSVTVTDSTGRSVTSQPATIELYWGAAV